MYYFAVPTDLTNIPKSIEFVPREKLIFYKQTNNVRRTCEHVWLYLPTFTMNHIEFSYCKESSEQYELFEWLILKQFKIQLNVINVKKDFITKKLRTYYTSLAIHINLKIQRAIINNRATITKIQVIKVIKHNTDKENR